MTAELAKMEQHKLQRFWSGRGDRMYGVLRTPLFSRLQNGEIRNIDIRHLHDRFGWQSGGKRLCVGTVYRTEAFMRLPDERRCGTRNGQTVHLEHTVPVKALVAGLSALPGRTPDETIAWILAHSVITAVTDGNDGERQRMVLEGQGSSSHAFNVGHLDEGLPFRRYNSQCHTAIWNVVTGRLVDANTFSFTDHCATIATILKWAGLHKWADLVITRCLFEESAGC